MYEKFTSVSGYVCNILFPIGEDGFETRKMTSFCKLFGRYQDPERKFPQLRDHSCTTYAKFKGGQSSTQSQETTVFRRSHGCGAPGLVYRVSMSLFKLMTKKRN